VHRLCRRLDVERAWKRKRRPAKMLIANNPAHPSHGRGHRFDPYSAHHFTGISETSLGSCRQQPAERSSTRRGVDVEDVPCPFAPYPLARSRRFSSRSTAALTNAVRSSPFLRAASIRSKVPLGNLACISSVHSFFRPILSSYEVLTNPNAHFISHTRFESKGNGRDR